MFACIACTKQMAEDGGEEGGGARGTDTPRTKEAVKSLTTQIKGVALKFSGAYQQCKPCTGSSSYKKGQQPSERVPHGSSSTPALDFTSESHHPGARFESRFTGSFGGDRTPGGTESCDVVLEDEDGPKEWMAQVEPGVHITFVSLPQGANDLKQIRFSRDMFDKAQAQLWWGENYDRIMELYNVQRFNCQSLNTPSRSEDEWTPRNHYKPTGSKGYDARTSAYASGGPRGEYCMDASRTTTSSRDEASVSVSNASEVETQWVEQDEPGVYITITQSMDGTRELRRVRFSREKFGEANAKRWWEDNRERIQAQYL
ncbi:protein BREVIS RADIX-like [Tripterygium wilfordii]|uniref:protein BREVIS RADIX-like n=1 Tax=Tripterygium wilfordii TaxID=458696 RepID=UPI0018F81902|nr:protein BREVIS RADIX-like [Tripterygium wilfordii]